MNPSTSGFEETTNRFVRAASTQVSKATQDPLGYAKKWSGRLEEMAKGAAQGAKSAYQEA